MNYLELENIDKFDNVYLIGGDEFVIAKAVQKIASKMGIQNINISNFDAENFDALAVVNVCNQFSFFNEKRIVCVKNLEKDLTANDKNLISGYIKNPNEDCVLLLYKNGGYFDFVKDVKEIDCKMGESYTLNFIAGEFNKNGKVIDSDAIKAIYSYTLGNFNRLTLEIQKVCDFLGNEKKVTKEIIDNLVFKDSELKVFDLTTALSLKNKEKSHKLLYDILKTGEPPIRVLGLISNHFRRLFFAKINKGSNAELAKQLNCKEFAIVKAKEQANLFGAKTLKGIQTLILETDYNIKSGQMTQENALYYLLFSILNTK